MMVMQAKSIELVPGQNAASSAGNDERDDAEGSESAAETAFAPLMNQMLGIAPQNEQQTAGEAGSESADRGTGRVYETLASLVQVSAQSTEQAEAALLNDSTPELPGVSAPGAGTGENTTTPFDALLKEVKADQTSESQTTTLAQMLPEVKNQDMTDAQTAAQLSGLMKNAGKKEDAGLLKPGASAEGQHASGKTVKGEKNGHGENSTVSQLVQAGEKNSGQPQGAAAESLGSDVKEGRHGAEQTASLAARSESATALHQDQSSVQHQAVVAAPAKGMNSAEVQAPRVTVSNPTEQFDHKVSIVRNGNRLAVQFEPDGLGKLDIDLRLDKGIVNAQIRVSDESTRSLIEGNMRQIMDGLMKEGLSVGGLSVALRENGSGDRQNNGWNGEGQNAQNANEPSPAGEVTRSLTARGLINIFV